MGSERGHYYTRDRRLIDGATLTDAKKNLYYPSVTTVLDQLAKNYGLVQWMYRQIIIATASTAQLDDESDTAFHERIMADAFHESEEAAARGTLIHASIAKHLEGKEAPDLPHDLREWIDANLANASAGQAAAETVVVSLPLGYAGTIDYWGMVTCTKDGSPAVAVLDFKTQRVKAKTPEWYPEWMYQLGGYAQILASDQNVPVAYQPVKFFSVVINTNKDRAGYTVERPGYWVKEWPLSEIQRGARIVNCLATLFYEINDKPRAPFPRPGTPERAAAEAKLFGKAAE